MAGTVRYYGPHEYLTQFLDDFDGHVSSKWAWQFVTITLVPSVRNLVPAVKVPFSANCCTEPNPMCRYGLQVPL